MTNLGVIEGFYGAPWSWEARARCVATLAPHGYGFYLYAPKVDACLRRRWTEPHPQAEQDALAKLAAHCRTHNTRFGVGLSPYDLFRAFNDESKAALKDKLAFFDSIGCDELAILFDDMRGDMEGLAHKQIEIMHWCAAHTKAHTLTLCPTYYSDDPALPRFFGAPPANYLEDLGRGLDPRIQMFWTGPEVCSREFTPGHLARVGGAMKRKPLLWDNYPVNDGPRMSQFLHLRAFTGRPAAIGAHIAGHAVNPALQPTLSLIPLISLAESYARGDAYDYAEAFTRAATDVCGDDLAALIQRHLNALQDTGLDALGEETRGKLKARFAPHAANAAAKEIIAWLDGKDRPTPEMFEGA